jgi:hypothetical protein
MRYAPSHGGHLRRRPGPDVLLLLFGAVVSGCGIDASASTTPSQVGSSVGAASTATSAPVSSPAPTSTSEQTVRSEVAWTEVPLDGTIVDVVADRSGFVAVGDGSSGTTSWVSRDGVAWEERDVPEKVVLEVDDIPLPAAMGQLVRLGDTLYSFGGNGFMDAYLGAGWRWTDGQQWEVIESTSDFFGTRVDAVAASDDALLASAIAFGGPMGHWTTWRWTPTTSWVRTPLSSTAEQVVSVTSVAWGAGTFVAVGFSAPFDADDAGASTNSIWTSHDGMTWTSVGVPDDDTTICALEATSAGGFVAVGRTAGEVVAWTSDDGSDWLVADMERHQWDASHPQGACEIVPIGEGVLALIGDGPETTLTWMSRDGGEWTAAEALEVGLRSAAAIGDDAVVVGSRANSDEGEQVVMRGHLDE